MSKRIGHEQLAEVIWGIAAEHHAAVGKENWMEYGYLPGSEELYAEWLGRGGELFEDRHEFNHVLRGIQATVVDSYGRQQMAKLLPVDDGERWLDVVELLSNCAGPDSPPEHRAYAMAAVRATMQERKASLERQQTELAGLIPIRGGTASALKCRSTDGTGLKPPEMVADPWRIGITALVRALRRDAPDVQRRAIEAEFGVEAMWNADVKRAMRWAEIERAHRHTSGQP